MLCTAIAIFQNIAKFSHQQSKNYDYSYLPPHILANIFSNLKTNDLKNSALVCKAWYYATCDPLITKRFTVWIKPGVTNMDFLCRPIKSIRFHNPQFNQFHYRHVIHKFSDSITDLYIYCDKIAHIAIFEIISNLPKLDRIQIYDGGSYFFTLNFQRHNKMIRHKEKIIKRLERIKYLQVTTLLKNVEPYKLFWRHCKNLETLHWKYNHRYSEDEYKEFIENFLDPNQNCTLKNLTELSIHNICKKWNSHFFEKMVHLNLKNIKKLSIGQISSAYYDVIFKEFCKVYRQLVHLYMNGCNDSQLYDICQYMVDIKVLELKNCEANNLQEICNLKSLESLALEQIFYAIDDGLLQVFQSKPKYLRRIELNIVSTILLITICENCKDLEVLKIEQVESKDCEPIFRNLTKLTNLFIRFSEWAKCHSTQIRSSDKWNILNLTRLLKLHISCYVPGITPQLIKQHPILDQRCMNGIWDPTDADLVQQELETQQYLNERYDDENERDPEEHQIFELSDFEWFGTSV